MIAPRQEIQDMVDWENITGSSDMSPEQKKRIVSLFMDQENVNDVIEATLQRTNDKIINELVASLCHESSEVEKSNVTSKIKSRALKILADYYDDRIDDEISDYRYERHTSNMEEFMLIDCGRF